MDEKEKVEKTDKIINKVYDEKIKKDDIKKADKMEKEAKDDKKEVDSKMDPKEPKEQKQEPKKEKVDYESKYNALVKSNENSKVMKSSGIDEKHHDTLNSILGSSEHLQEDIKSLQSIFKVPVSSVEDLKVAKSLEPKQEKKQEQVKEIDSKKLGMLE